MQALEYRIMVVFVGTVLVGDFQCPICKVPWSGFVSQTRGHGRESALAR